jgi:uncharacterized protein (DUF488 family)
MKEEKNIWTIGHSTRSLEEFVELLRAFDIIQLVDIRNYPGSKRYPHFNKEALELTMPQNGISYIHLKDLGGRRNPKPGSVNTGWRNSAFRGYADYMETDNFKNAIEQLENIATKKPTAYMCSEAVWWSCHRSLVSDYMKVRGWNVLHIMATNKATEHPFTKPARVVDGELTYTQPGLFN